MNSFSIVNIHITIKAADFIKRNGTIHMDLRVMRCSFPPFREVWLPYDECLRWPGVFIAAMSIVNITCFIEEGRWGMERLKREKKTQVGCIVVHIRRTKWVAIKVKESNLFRLFSAGNSV